MLRRADFYKLFCSQDDSTLLELRARCCNIPHPFEHLILEYLNPERDLDFSGTHLFNDRLANIESVGGFGWYSDGEWVWSNATWYYIKNYHFRIPQDFVEHMAAKNWSPPKEIDKTEIAAAFRNAPLGTEI
jgi:hypothetical protein